MSIQGLVYLVFYAWFWFLIWACGISAGVHLLQDFGIYFLLIEYLKSYFMVIGGIVVVLGIIALPATATGIGIVLGVVFGFAYVYVKSILFKIYKILRYGPPGKNCIKNRKQKTYQQSQQNFSENYQRENTHQHFHDKSQQEDKHSSNHQESSKKEQSRQSNKQDHYYQQQTKERKSDLSMPSTLAEACSVLGTQPGLPLEEYKRIWKKEALRYHPDRTRDLGERLQKYAEEEMKRINKAWEIIKSAA